MADTNQRLDGGNTDSSNNGDHGDDHGDRMSDNGSEIHLNGEIQPERDTSDSDVHLDWGMLFVSDQSNVRENHSNNDNIDDPLEPGAIRFGTVQHSRDHHRRDNSLPDIGGRDFTDELPKIPLVLSRIQHHKKPDSGLREYTTGHEPHNTFLLHHNNLQDVPELGHSLKSFMQEVGGQKYLPLTAYGVRKNLEAWINGHCTIDDMSIFRNLLLDRDTWESQKDFLCQILGRVGNICHQLVLRGGGVSVESEVFPKIWGRALSLLPVVEKVEARM